MFEKIAAVFYYHVFLILRIINFFSLQIYVINKTQVTVYGTLLDASLITP